MGESDGALLFIFVGLSLVLPLGPLDKIIEGKVLGISLNKIVGVFDGRLVTIDGASLDISLCATDGLLVSKANGAKLKPALGILDGIVILVEGASLG